MRQPPIKAGEPPVLDLIEADPRVTSAKEIIGLRPHAKRFIFDAEGSTHLGHFIRDCGDLIVANRQFAIPPFQTTYVQCDMDAMLKAIGGPTSGVYFGDKGRDSHVGYLIHKQCVRVIVQGWGEDDNRVMPGVFVYDMNTPAGAGPIFEEPVIIGDKDDEWARLALLLASSQDHVQSEATRLDIIRSVRIRLADQRFAHISRMQRRTQIAGGAGDIRNLWAMLLMINAKRVGVSFRDVPWHAALYKGKRRVFGAHSVVSIHLSPKQSIRGFMRPGLHTPRAAHDVRGHFAHWHLRDGCVHEWSPFPELTDGVPRWNCERCGGLRVWRKDYTTGDSSIGFTTKDYTVTK